MKQKRTENRQNDPRIQVLIKSVLIAGSSLTFGWFLIPHLVYMLIASKIVISPESSEFYAIWLTPPIPVYFNVTMFNVTNPEEIEMGMSPRFKEVGPYIFKEIRSKINITLDDGNDTATYMQHVRYEFISELSDNKSLTDVITMINVPFVAAAVRVERSVPWPLSHIAHMILLNYKEPLFVQKTVEEALFKGWKVPLLEKIEEDIGLTFLENNTFSFFMGMNDTHQGPYTVKRGIQGDKDLLGKITDYRNEPVLPYWGDRNSSCNKLKGTDAFIFSPFKTKDTIVHAFNPDLCGSISTIYNSDIEIEGVCGFKYTIPKYQLASPRESVENRCYCHEVDRDPDKCLASGAVDLGPCRDGAPIALTLPHFLDADPVYLQDIAEGVKPEREKHETFIALEPLTGIVLEAHKRFQLSMILKRVPSIPSLSKVKDMLFPCLWADEGALLDEPNGQRLRFVLLLVNLTQNGFKIVSLIIAVLFPVVFLKRQFRLEVAAADSINNDITMMSVNTAEKIGDNFCENDHFLRPLQHEDVNQ